MTDKIEQIKNLLRLNREDALRAERYVPAFRSQVLMQLRVEREQLEHQLLLITGFKEAEVTKIVGDLHLPAPSKPKDDDDGKELVRA